MSARTPRRTFAAPFVVTLAAAAPACYVQSRPGGAQGPQPPPPSQPQPQPQTTPPPQGPGTVVMNPPRPQPTDPQTQPTTPTPPPTTPTTPTTVDTKWTVYKRDGACYAAEKVTCQPQATCNPPPPFKYECPKNVALDQPVTVAANPDGQSCYIQYDMPKCPPNVACNPPRPQPVTCPKR